MQSLPTHPGFPFSRSDGAFITEGMSKEDLSRAGSHSGITRLYKALPRHRVVRFLFHKKVKLTMIAEMTGYCRRQVRNILDGTTRTLLSKAELALGYERYPLSKTPPGNELPVRTMVGVGDSPGKPAKSMGWCLLDCKKPHPISGRCCLAPWLRKLAPGFRTVTPDPRDLVFRDCYDGYGCRGMWTGSIVWRFCMLCGQNEPLGDEW